MTGRSDRWVRPATDEGVRRLPHVCGAARADLPELCEQTGWTKSDIDFWCSGSSDYLAGRAFSFVSAVDAIGALPPVMESHVEMDAAWALYEAWVKIQTGLVDTALVYGFGKSSAGQLRRVMSLQMDPYTVTPLWADAVSVAAMQARSGLESGACDEAQMAAVVARSMSDAAGNEQRDPQGRHDGRGRTGPADVRRPAAPLGLRPGLRRRRSRSIITAADTPGVRPPARSEGVDHRLRAPHRAGRAQQPRPHGLREHDVGRRRRRRRRASTWPSCMRRSRTRSSSSRTLSDSATTYASTRRAGRSPPTRCSPPGLNRIGEAARQVWAGNSQRALAHATSGPALQQNLVMTMEARA